jgi:hypothetical protein
MRWLGLVVVGAVLAGCGGGGGDDKAAQSTSEPPKATSTSAKPERKSFDPPKVFSSSPAATLTEKITYDSEVVAALSDGNVYVGDTKTVEALDGLSGSPLWTVQPTLPPMQQTKPHAPVVDEDKHLVYYAFSVKVPGKGTTPSHPAFEVVAVEATSGKKEWTTTVDVATEDPGNVTDGDVRVIAATAGSVVVTWFSNTFSVGNTYVLDTGTHQVRWKHDQFLAGDVDTDIVVGNAGKPFISEKRTFTGLGLADGAEKWATPPAQTPAEIMPVSPKLVATNRQDYDSGDYQFDIVDVTTGKSLYTRKVDTPLGLSYRVDCHYDLKSIFVCADSEVRVFAFEAANVGQKPLWEITQSTARVPPSVTAAYHGLIYGMASGSGPVALDAKTGEDAPDAPGLAPILVDKYVGIEKKGEARVPTK